jgi:hypothetical protein
VAFAQQRVLPLERQRRHLKVVSFTTLRTPLLTAFRDLQALLTADAARAAAPAPEPAPEPAPSAAVPEPAQPGDAPQPEAFVPQPSDPAPDPYRAAFAPLVNLLADTFASAFANALRPLLAETVTQVLAGRPAQAAPPAAPAAPAPTAPKPTPEPERHAAPREIKACVGVLVNRTDPYRQELASEFPWLEFRCVDTPKKIDALKNCDKVIAMTRFVGHDAESKAKEVAGDRFARCPGAMSELKRMINLWIAARELPQRPGA